MILVPLVLAVSLASLLGVGPPYRVEGVAGASPSRNTVVYGLLSCDLDGDGVDEYVSGVKEGFLVHTWRDGAARAVEQCNLPPRFLARGGHVSLGAAVDVDGDGRREVVATARTGDGWDQRLFVVDVGGDSLLLDVALPAGPDVRKDGIWDGSHDVLGVVESDGRLLGIVARQVQYDRLTRAVNAYDLRTGGLVWSFASAGNASRGLVADLDGDGEPEIVVDTGSGDNFKGDEEVRGRRDDTAWIIALHADGSLMWETEIAGRFAQPTAQVVDLDGDGSVEVVATSGCSAPGFRNAVSVLDGRSGAVRARVHEGNNGFGFTAWYDAAAGEGVIVSLVGDPALDRYVWRDGTLQRAGGFRLPAPPRQLLADDFLPEPGPELWVSLADNRVVFLSSRLRPLAKFPPTVSAEAGAGIWRLGRDAIVMYPNEANLGYRLVAVPVTRRYARAAGAGALLLALGAAGGTTLRQRRRLARLRRTSRRDLLRAFLTARHGTVGPVGACERVMWSLDNPVPGQEGRPAEIWAACRAEAVQDLEALLEKAAHIRLDPPLLAVVRRELAKLVRLYDEVVTVPADDPRRAPLQRTARTCLGLVGDGVKSLGSTLAAGCVLDPWPVVRDLVTRHAARRPEVAFRLEPLPDPLPPCHADAADLEFALDNLLDNAGRFAGGDDPRVTISLETDADAVRIRVEDSGPGVPPEDRDHVFRRGTTTRESGGGVGLWHSRQALRYYGGDLVLDAAPAGGARFTVVLRTGRG